MTWHQTSQPDQHCSGYGPPWVLSCAALRRTPQAALPGRLRGLILPVMLVIITLLAILSASFSFHIRAHNAALHANQSRLQLRQAAESGIHYALLLLRENRHDSALWYDNEELFHNRVLWSMLGDAAEREVDEQIDTSSVTFRFSLVADDPYDDTVGVRYGITDESAKLNINTATRAQLNTLFAQVLPEDMEIEALVDALIDWRDSDDQAGEQGAEAEYYYSLEPPYSIKNNAFETVEELLLVKGFTAGVLFGEDYDRNGLLTPNEKDGFEQFPPDNQDEILQRGLYPFITVSSRDMNRSNDNLNRINLNGGSRQVQEELQALELFSEDLIEYIANARRNNVTFTSPVQLLDHTYTPGGKDPGAGGDGTSGDEAAPADGGSEKPEAGGLDGLPGLDGVGGEENQDDEEGSEGMGGSRGRGRGRGEGATRRPRQNAPQPELSSPATAADLPALCDYTTTVPQPVLTGLININTAPREVLMCLTNDAFTEAEVDALIAARDQVDADLRVTAAWPVSEDVISQEAYATIYPLITTRGLQFQIESIGHADHLGMMVRLQVLVELRGQVPQVLYYRDISELGTYPIRGTEEGEHIVRDRRR